MQNHINFNSINHSLLPQIDVLLAEWLPGGYREGKEYVALNPLRHDNTHGSFRINRITGRWGDFATGNHGGDIISLYAYLNRIGQAEAAKALSSQSIPVCCYGHNVTPTPSKSPKEGALGDTQVVQKIWQETLSAENTSVEKYLSVRGYWGQIPDTLRYHPHLFHTASNKLWPGMVAAVSRWPDVQMIAVHRTYLASDGLTKAPITPNKMMLGSVAGGAVRLGDVGNVLVIAEGIESALSVHYFTALPVWAALSASNMKTLVLPPPDIVTEIIIAADHDGAGLAAAYDSAEEWQAQGRRVKIALPPEGQDFNDVLMAGGL